MKQVTRYDLIAGDVQPFEEGDYVTYCDYVSLAKEKEYMDSVNLKIKQSLNTRVGNLLEQIKKEDLQTLSTDAYMSIITYWKNRCEKIMTQANADIDEIIKLTRGVAKRSSLETDARLAEFIRKGDAAQDVEVIGNTLEERKESLKGILKQQRRESIINDIASQIGRGTFYEDAERIYDIFIDKN